MQNRNLPEPPHCDHPRRGADVSLPADLQRGLGGVHGAGEATVLRDVGQRHHAVVVGDQDDVNGGQVHQFPLERAVG